MLAPASAYAIGKLVLWSKTSGLVKGEETLKAASFAKPSICNPAAAPYGAAALETMKALKIYETLQLKLVEGATITQAYQFLETGDAELGFVALLQLTGPATGSRWVVPQQLYSPIRQDAVLLKSGASNEAATGFITFLKGPKRAPSSRNTATFSTDKADRDGRPVHRPLAVGPADAATASRDASWLRAPAHREHLRI